MWFDLMSTLDDVHMDVDSLLLVSGRSVRLAPQHYLCASTAERRLHYEDVWRSVRDDGDDGLPPAMSLLRRMTRKGPDPFPAAAHYLRGGDFCSDTETTEPR